MPSSRGRPGLSDIRRLVLDVLKPHRPSIIDLAGKLSAIKGVDGVNCVLEEVDQETESVTITLEGTAVDYERVEQALREAGAVIHSIDEVALGKKLVEAARISQD